MGRWTLTWTIRKPLPRPQHPAKRRRRLKMTRRSSTGRPRTRLLFISQARRVENSEFQRRNKRLCVSEIHRFPCIKRSGGLLPACRWITGCLPWSFLFLRHLELKFSSLKILLSYLASNFRPHTLTSILAFPSLLTIGDGYDLQSSLPSVYQSAILTTYKSPQHHAVVCSSLKCQLRPTCMSAWRHN